MGTRVDRKSGSLGRRKQLLVLKQLLPLTTPGLKCQHIDSFSHTQPELCSPYHLSFVETTPTGFHYFPPKLIIFLAQFSSFSPTMAASKEHPGNGADDPAQPSQDDQEESSAFNGFLVWVDHRDLKGYTLLTLLSARECLRLVTQSTMLSNPLPPSPPSPQALPWRWSTSS